MGNLTTVGKILLKNAVPVEYQQFVETHELDKKNIDTLLRDLSKSHPVQYKDVVSKLTRLGFELSTRMGSTVRLSDLLPPPNKAARFAELDKDIADVKLAKLTKVKETDKINELYGKFTEAIDKEIIADGLKTNKTLAKVVKAGARGSATQYRQTIFAPVAVNDAKGRILTDFPVRQSFAEGLSIPEYLAHTFGSRQGTVSTKMATADAGYVNKQLSRATTTIKVEEHDCGTLNGVEMPIDDRDSIGCFLAAPVGGFNRNNEVTGPMLNTLKDKGVSSLRVRSVMTCESAKHFHPGAVCQLCVGRRDKGLPAIDDYVGLTAGNSLAEPLSQGVLNCLVEDTLVRMGDYSIKKIQDIEPGEIVLGADSTGNSFPVKVVNVFNQGPQPVSEYKFRIGCTREFTTVKATSIHKILCNVKKWSCFAQADNQKLQVLPISHIGRDFYAIKPKKFLGQPGKNSEFALLLGILLGDGCYTEKTGGPNLSCADLSQIEALNSRYVSKEIKCTLKAGHTIYYRVGHPLPHKPNPIRQLLKDLKMWGKYAHEKTIPEEVYTWDDASVAELIAGLIVTDGSVYTRVGGRPGISFSSTSKLLVEQVKELLAWRFCVYGTTVTKTRDCVKRKLPGHDQWQITVTDKQSVANFAKLIPLIGVKREKMVKLLANLSKVSNVGYPMHRIGVTPSGRLPCWDIEVDHTDHLFVLANGIIVSNTKHQSGSARKKSEASGFKLINQIVNIPDTFKDKAPLTAIDGQVVEIRVAPQGGSYVVIKPEIGKNEEYYVPEGLDVKVQLHQHVESGDVLSEGIINPAEVVKYKGIGEGRRYFAAALREAFSSSGLHGINRRNFELVAKAAIDHVKVTNNEGVGDYLPNSVVSYHNLVKNYVARPGSSEVRPDFAFNKYLEEPVLHYSIGTRVSKSMIDELRRNHIASVKVHSSKPDFEPEMQRLLDVPIHEHDWMHQLYSTNLERRLLASVNSGATSDTKGPSPVPGLAYGVGFGLK